MAKFLSDQADLWTGEEIVKKGAPILKQAGFKHVDDLQRTALI